jgi:hypothetical protein
VKARPATVALAAAAWLAVAVAAVVLYQRAAQVPEAMPRSDFERSVRQLRSDALEARALALGLAAGQLTTHFALEQHEALGDDLRDVRKALDKPAPKDGEAEAARARSAVDRLENALKQVPSSLADGATLRRIAEEEAAIARDIPGSPP